MSLNYICTVVHPIFMDEISFYAFEVVFFPTVLFGIKHLPGRLLMIQIIVEIGKSNNYELRSSVFRK